MRQTTKPPTRSQRNRKKPSQDHFRLLSQELTIQRRELEMQYRELRHVYEHLKKSRNQYENLYHQAPVGYASLDENTFIHEMNETGVRLLGWKREDLKGRSFLSLLKKENRQELLNHLKKSKTNKHSLESELEIKRKNGETGFFTLVSCWAIDPQSEKCLCQVTFTDISEKKHAQLEFLRSEEKFHMLVESSPHGMILADQHGVISLVSKEIGLMFGYEPKELIGESIDLLIPNDTPHQLTAFQSHDYPHSQPRSIGTNRGFFGRDRKGRKIPIDMVISPIPTSHGNFLLTSVTDISEQKETEQRLEGIRSFLTTVIESMPDMVFVKEPENFKYVELNKAGEDLLGCSRYELIGRTDRDYFPEKEAILLHQHDRETLKAGKLTEIMDETVHTRKNGTRILHTRRVPIFDGTGKPQYILGIAEDVTEKIILKRRLEKKEKEFSILADNMPVFFSYVDLEFRYHFVNKHFSHSVKKSKEEISGKHIRAVHGERYFNALKGLMEQVLTGEVVNFDTRVTNKKGEIRWISGFYYPDLGIDNRVRGFFELYQDVTQRKLLEKDVLNATDSEQQRIARELHDGLGQKLLAVGMLSDLLIENLRERGAPEVNEAGRISSLIKDTLAEMRKISRGLYAADLSEKDLHTALEQLTKNFMSDSRINCRLQCEGPLLVDEASTAMAIYRITQEALNNVLKHSQAKNVFIKVESANDLINIEIKDDGRGLPVDYLNKSGMGFRTMQYRAETAGGSVRFKSNPMKGTVVLISIPSSIGVCEDLVGARPNGENEK